jgi:hypothetical protein
MMPRPVTEGGEDEFNVVNTHLWLVNMFSNTHASRKVQGIFSKTEVSACILSLKMSTPVHTSVYNLRHPDGLL